MGFDTNVWTALLELEPRASQDIGFESDGRCLCGGVLGGDTGLPLGDSDWSFGMG
jgi:hypothetical protein